MELEKGAWRKMNQVLISEGGPEAVVSSSATHPPPSDVRAPTGEEIGISK